MADDPETSLPSDQPQQNDDTRADQRVVNTQGGDYAEGGIDKRQGTFVAGDQFNLSGDFRDATVYIKSTIYQQILRPVPYPFRAGVQRMVEDYTAIFGGRDAELAQLDEFLLQDERPFALLLAPTGRGKTALLINWIARVQQAYPQWRIVFAPISIRYQTASEQVTLGLLAYALAEIHSDLEQFRSYDQSTTSLRAIIADYLRRPLPEAVRLLVVIDGLDEAIGWTVSGELFPRKPDHNLRIIVAARDVAHRSRRDWYDELGFAAEFAHDLELGELGQEGMRDIVQRVDSLREILSTNPSLSAEIERVSQGDPLTLRFLIEDLKTGDLTPGRLKALTPGLESFVKDWMEELERGSSVNDGIYALLRLCAVALGPLTSIDVQCLEPEIFKRRAALNQTAKAMKRFVLGDGSVERGYVFSHYRLRELYLEKILATDECDMARQRLVQYGKD